MRAGAHALSNDKRQASEEIASSFLARRASARLIEGSG